MLNFGKFVDEMVSTYLILRQKVSNFIFESIILALIIEVFFCQRVEIRKSILFKGKFAFKKNYINIFALKII